MDAGKKVNVAIVGLGFGKEFIAIYQRHPKVGKVGICARGKAALDEVGDKFHIPKEDRFSDIKAILGRPDFDAIHVVSPIADHARQSLASLEAGKHTACTVPMGTTLEELTALIRARKQSGKVYMNMETAVYTREFLYARKLAETGQLGRIQFVRGSHMQNMGLEGWPDYWLGFPPMHYGTHAISPLVELAGAYPESVVCHGSGAISQDLARRYGSPFAVATATFKFRNSNVIAEATRSLFETVRQDPGELRRLRRQDGPGMGADRGGGHGPLRGRRERPAGARPGCPGTAAPGDRRLHPQGADRRSHPRFLHPGRRHGGSHPHLVHEFVSAIVEGRESAIDAVRSAYYSAAGICAHQSALAGGARIFLPEFEKL